MHRYIHTYIYTYTHTYIHTYILTKTETCRSFLKIGFNQRDCF